MSVAIATPYFVGVGCNLETSCLAWGTSLVAYGCGNSVALYSPQTNSLLGTFAGASSPITNVAWVQDDVLVASCNDGLLVVHLGLGGEENCVLNAQVAFERVGQPGAQHFHGVCVVHDARGPGESLIVMAGSHLASFLYSSSTRSCVSLKCLMLPPRQMSECVAGAILPLSKIAVVAVGGADRKVHLYVDDNHAGLAEITWLEGHQDWIRDLAFTKDPDTEELLLASCSSDSFIRLWRIARFLDAPAEPAVSDLQESERRQRVVFAVNDGKGSVPRFTGALDALMIGHAHWVQSVCWSSDARSLISASMDKTMIVWEKDPDEGIWIDKLRLGEIGGNALGFFGAVFSPDSQHVMAHSYNGSLHLWRRNDESGLFEALPTVSGHTNIVTDVCWDASGRYFASSSLDQTVRLWAPWQGHNGDFYELARPQIHGHDINTISLLRQPEHTLVSGADEKTIRVFGATESFCSSLLNVTGAQLPTDGKKRAFGATMPPLGLSNKPLGSMADAQLADEARKKESFPEEVWKADPMVLEEPPVETQLSQSTLWVEEQKLYGHGSELYAIATSPDGSLVASGCKGKAKPHTDILLWRTSDWTVACRLSCHKMTVTRIAFSSDGQWIASVARDLRLALWKRTGEDQFILSWSQEKAHQRIIWDCCFSPDEASLLFITCSRDKRATTWRLDREAGVLTPVSTLKRSVPLTSVAFYPCKLPDDSRCVALGNAEGGLSLWKISNDVDCKWTLWKDLHHYHSLLRISRLQFQYVPAVGSVLLLSSGEDFSVRLMRVGFTDAFSQLCALCACAHVALNVKIPKPVVARIWELIKPNKR